MARVFPLDRLINEAFPRLRSEADVRAFEATPYRERIAAQSTYEALQLGAACDPSAPAIQFLRNADADETPLTVSFAQFMARVTQAANMFADLGVGPNDVVSFLLPLLPQSFFTLFGAEAVGIANPVNPLLEPHQLVDIFRAAGTKILVALGPTPGTEIWEKVSRIRSELPGLEAILQVNGTGDEQDGVYSFDKLLERYPADRLVSGRQITSNDVAAYFTTGGTTGLPKLVRHTHGNQVYQAWLINLMFASQPGRNMLFGLPLFHVAGALTQGLANLASGVSLVVLSPTGWRNPAAVKNIWKLVERYKPLVLGGVPTVFTASLGVPVADADISSIRCAAGGGSAMPVGVSEAIQKRTQAPVLEVYGMTETASVFAMAYADRPVRLGSVGHAVPYSKMRVVKVDAQGRYVGDCATNEIGVVAINGPGVFTGYLDERHSRQAFVEAGWVNSGDLGRFDEDGYLWLTGRAKDLIIRGSHNIDPGAIEEIFFHHPAIALAAVVGQPDAYAGELPIAFVQLKADAKVTETELIEYVRTRTPERAAVPVAVVIVAAIPLTAVGKVFKPELRRMAAQRVFAETLVPLAQNGINVVVSVAAHEKHGSLATFTITGVTKPTSEEIARQVGERMKLYAQQWEIVWG